MALNAQDAINVGVEEVEDVEQEEVLPQAQRRGRNANANVNANNNIPDPLPPPPRVAPRVLPNQGYASAIVPPRIRAGNFQITNVMLTLLEQRGYFTSASDQNAYKHLKGFVDTYWGSKQTNVSEDALRLRLIPFSLRGKALDWLERLPNHSITTWDELVDKFIAKFFSPSHMEALRDEILAFKQEPTEPLHEIWEWFWMMVKECPNNDMNDVMIQQTFYRGINTTNQCIVNQLAGGNFMKLPYNEACDVLDEMADTSSAWQSRDNVPQGDPNVIHLHKELHDHSQAIAELTTTMTQLAKAQLQQVQNLRQVNAMEGVNMMKRRQTWKQQPQENFDNYDDGGGYSNEGFDDQSKEVQYVNNCQRNREELQNDEIPLVVEDVVEQSASDDVRIEIDEGEEETQEAVNPSREHVIDMTEPMVPKAKAPLPRPPPPYPQRLAKQKGDNQFKKFIEMMKSLTINVPLVEALEQMPGYAKFMKDLVTKKRSMECETIKMTHQVSSIVHSMAPKLEDPGAFTIPYTIGSADFVKALCDLGASINLMPYSVFKTLVIGQPCPTSMRLQMAD
ncbi:uncharacterized protein [Nicotiana sylvestris]|uniref:uncharacterized protein n=1 Tax=Nicotiana sylvestris TaxID=4096 RepID=UPI00388C4758